MTRKFNDQMAALYQGGQSALLETAAVELTNYAALVYAAILYLVSNKLLEGKLILSVIVAVTCLANIGVLLILQDDMKKFRHRIQWVYDKYFTQEQRKALKLTPRDRAKKRACTNC